MFQGKEVDVVEEMEVMRKKCHCLNKKHRLYGDSSNGCWVSYDNPPPEKTRISQINTRSDQNSVLLSSNDNKVDGSSGVEPQDADYTYIPWLSFDLLDVILASFPRSEYWKLSFVNKRYLTLLKSGELFKIRREIKVKEPSVFMLAVGDQSSWWSFDHEFKSCRKLPVLPADFCFTNGDKESLCAGSHLLVSGMELDGLVIWRYELKTNRWCRGPSMINPRCLFASATCGTYAFVAGGIGMGKVYDTAEKYNPESKSWEPLPRMLKRRKFCSGCYMDNKFYVIGGRNEVGELTCGEYYDESLGEWVLIPDMLKDDPVLTSYSPPLVAVVNNELFSLETSSNQLKVYLKKSNKWKQLGRVPVRADATRGWGVAFKSLGNELLVIGASAVSSATNCMVIYTCCPDPNADNLLWKPLGIGQTRISNFILNCSIMGA
ncbi:F-box/kelch-repeat protein At3g27150-like [Cornus florida]|uniref:F-box/kelch-repeat protein At3g27150-like n=1 Tax=Cornus florida TaxID=4283 RepID=UPI0028999827|nr:F-box/kelch-repeat protein At3g27150-like [Cornus florida]